ncbi:MAG: MerR family transcriptional regulator [Deltaproteobacteria bacterium HGW-Deltaproteobacteria-15]|jgi:MerR family transcriptional regulator/heat shock protein HspR|nr:MAG: MerR family transcriptional regulator [Deltaproteobacteria bacterium HGW-Deltaproteobacteria-15]
MKSMKKKFWTMTEVMEIYEVDETFMLDLEREEILWPVRRRGSSARLYSDRDLESLRLAKILVEEMGVNLEGVEIILRMRESMFQMRSQFDDILEDLARQLRDRIHE